MQYILSKQFEKDFAKLPENTKKKALSAIELFTKNPDDLSFRKHSLKGKYVGHFSIDITGDVRAVYFIVKDNVAYFITTGTHSKLYK